MSNKSLASGIGAVTFCYNVFPRYSHALTLLHRLTKSEHKGQFDWTSDCPQEFDEVKAMLTRDPLICFPDPFSGSEQSDTQLGTVIVQDAKPADYFSRELNAVQRKCAAMEKELISIVATLKDHRVMLCGVKELHVHTDHKNLT